MEQIRTTKFKDLELNDEMVSIKSSQPISEALALLQSKNIRTLGVLSDDEKLIGLVTVFDIMTYICFGSFNSPDVSSNTDIESAMKSLDISVGKVTGVFHNETNKTWHFNDTDLVLESFDIMCLGVHQAAIKNSDGKYKLVSQHDLVKFFQKFEKALGLDKTLDVAGLAKEKSCSVVKESDVALFAFRRMEESENTALPVVDGSNQVVGTISVSDVRSLSTNNMDMVLKPVLEFLEGLHGKPSDPITCTSSTTIYSVIRDLVESFHRHVWLVNDDGKLIGCISLTDIIDYCADIIAKAKQ